MKSSLYFVIFLIAFVQVSLLKANQKDSLYFPPNNSNEWAGVSIENLQWNPEAIQSLKTYLIETHTQSFMVLVNGKIAIEWYFNGHTADSEWQWNSAGKTLVGTTVGIAFQNGLLKLDDKASDYLGKNWTSSPIEKENQIQIQHLLTMTSGLNDEKQLVRKKNLTYLADAGSRWAYSNVFQKLMDVVSTATHQEFEDYFNSQLENKIGMSGHWEFGPIFKIYHSNTRSMARFGLLALNLGKWKTEQIVDQDFFKTSIQTSQTINPSYGYFWWLNGKESYMLPNSQKVYQGNLVPNAPKDMYAAMGAADQRLYIVPSKSMVVVRMGKSSNPRNRTFAVSGFDDTLWGKINSVLK